MPYSQHDHLGELARVDPLFLAGGISLAFVAGFVNTISLCYFHVPISHMTGAVTRLSMDAATLNFSELINLSYIVSGFLLGAVISGTIIGAANFKPSKEYSLVMMLESILLASSFFLFESKANFALFIVAFSCGLQNAMASNYLGLIVRTTHLTGIVTDLGLLIGHALKHRKVKAWKIGFLLSILLGFFAGGLAGFSVFGKAGYYSIFVPSAMCMAGAVGFYFLRVRNRIP
ncbi:MAG TPA: YoaK family protein [Fibrobacteria bacterium]|nr:YoaK family protein [Fibrobacteria bacterium]